MLHALKAKADHHPSFPATSPAREALRTAIDLRDRMAARVREAEAAHGRVVRLVHDVEARLARFHTIDADIAADRLDRVKTWAATEGSGGHGMPPHLANMPPHLAELKRKRDVLRNECDEVRAIEVDLARELDVMRIALANAEANIGTAIDTVVIEAGVALAEEYDAARHRALELHDILKAMAGELGGRPAKDFVEFPKLLVDVFREPFDCRPGLPFLESYVGKQRPQWRRFMVELRSNHLAVRG